MKTEQTIEQLSTFVVRASYEDLSAEARRQIKVRVLDSLGCAIGAIGLEPIPGLRDQVEGIGCKPLVTMIGVGKISPDRAAFYNGALMRHLGFNDSHLSGKRLCHPSESLPAVLAASEYAGASGRDFLTALAAAYQVQCRLCEVSSQEVCGCGRGTPAAYAVAAGVAKALKLNQEQTTNALAAAVTVATTLEVPGISLLSGATGSLFSEPPSSLAYYAALAMSSAGGAGEASGPGGTLSEPAASGIDWAEGGVDAVCRTAIKKYQAPSHSQSALEAVLYLRDKEPAPRTWVERIELDTFDVGYDLLGGNGGGGQVRTRAEAYRSLPYLLAVALLDGEVTARQYEPERIHREDVQTLMRKVFIRPDGDFSRRFPEEMPARVQIVLRDGQVLRKEMVDYEGYVTRPTRWQTAVEKFKDLTVLPIGYEASRRLIEKVLGIEEINVRELTELLAGAPTRGQAGENVLPLRQYKLAA